jgi:vitamin B12/bleomycin/antimicrobial peptide transport system ATP-binding/permease protein
LLFAAPKYLAGDLSLGQVTQLAAAFIQVQIAISWVVDNYNRIAEWYASARRVMDIVDACDAIDARPSPSAVITAPNAEPGALVTLDAVSATGSNGEALFGPLGLSIARGQWVHFTGASSAGKSTLTRIMAGLSMPSAGHAALAPAARVLILPQKAYLPLGSLRDVLRYPDADAEATTGKLTAALARVGLAHLAPRLDDAVRWDQSLSNGERQRIGVARVLLHHPDIAILDDAVSALDEPSRDALLRALRQDCPTMSLITLGQKPLANGFSARQIVLTDIPASSVHADAYPKSPALTHS